jgi:hypothetical protein
MLDHTLLYYLINSETSYMNPWEVDILVPLLAAGRLLKSCFPSVRPSVCTCIMTEERVHIDKISHW